MTDRYKLNAHAELPDLAITWRDSTGALIPFASEAHTFRLIIDTRPRVVKGTLGGAQVGITVADTAPNVVVAFAIGDLDLLPSGFYAASLEAQRADGKRRPPLRFDVELWSPITTHAADVLGAIGVVTVTATDTL